MKIAYNKVAVSREIKKKIRAMFFKQIEMPYIQKEVGLTERVIRRVINENNWIKVRERYLRYLCTLSYIKGISLGKMAEITEVKECALCRIHRKYNTPRPQLDAWNKKVNDIIEKKFILEYNDGNTAQHIADKYGFKTSKTILDVLKKNAIERRPSKIQTFYKEDFFEKINSPEKAYILGLIMTDGYIIKDYTGFGIQLTKNDGYLLEKIASIIGARQGVTEIICDTKRKTMPNTKDMTRLTVHNRKIAEDLKLLGVTRRKSKTLAYNDCVPKKYLSHFFRGLVDGDGSIGKDSRGYYWMTLASASKTFLEEIRCNNFLWSINSFKYKNGSYIHSLKVSGGQKEIFRFYKWIYNNKGDLYLRRKYEKVQNKID
jgi:hypothetical protein